MAKKKVKKMDTKRYSFETLLETPLHAEIYIDKTNKDLWLKIDQYAVCISEIKNCFGKGFLNENMEKLYKSIIKKME